MNASPPTLLFGAWLTAFLLLPAAAVWAYRPFVSTDAAVADPNAFEIELGYLNWRREIHEETFTVRVWWSTTESFPTWSWSASFRLKSLRTIKLGLSIQPCP